MKITVIGAGRWGTFIAWYFEKFGCDVTIYGRANSAAFSLLKKTRKNEYLDVPEKITLTSDLSFALSQAEIVIVSVSSQNLRELLLEVAAIGFGDKTYVLCMKGLECETGKRLSEVAVESGINPDKLAVWVGPGHIQEFVLGKPNCMVIDSANRETTKRLVTLFKSKLIRFYYGEDLIGSEIGAAAKNVIGIAAGILDGGGYTTLKGPLMARGAHEVARLIKAMGGNELSAYGLCHLGDYETTLFSEYSNNRRFGEAYVKGESFKKLAEGVMTAKAMKLLGEKFGVELPITEAVYRIVFEKHDALSELLRLFSRAVKSEFGLF